jgi:isocitrate dehydrogenase
MAAASVAKIKVANPVVDLDGDEMTRCVVQICNCVLGASSHTDM